MNTLFPPDYEDEVDRSTVYYVLVQCPVRRCRSDDCPVTSTRGKIREHKCQVCGYCFKSVQKELIPADSDSGPQNL